jgi:hypothetical protein
MTDSAEVAVLGTGRLLRAGTREKVISRFAEYEEHLDHDRSYHRGCHVGGFSLATKAGSSQLALDPLRGHPDCLKRLDEPGARATLKQLAGLGETFVVSDEGVVLSMVRLQCASSGSSDGSKASWCGRHDAAAHISELTGAVAIVVSEDPLVRVFEDGKLVREISPGHDPWGY